MFNLYKSTKHLTSTSSFIYWRDRREAYNCKVGRQLRSWEASVCGVKFEQMNLAIRTNTFWILDKYTLKPGQESLSALATAAQGKQSPQLTQTFPNSCYTLPFLFVALKSQGQLRKFKNYQKNLEDFWHHTCWLKRSQDKTSQECKTALTAQY